MNTKHIQHLFSRAGFGITPIQLESLSNVSKTDVVEQLFSESKDINPLTIDLTEFDSINSKELFKDKKAIKQFLYRCRIKSKELNIAWIERLMSSESLLRERMTLFWTNHFVCRDNNVIFVEQYQNTLRKYAFGNFRDFVKAISKEPAMIKYLNNKQNVKQKPNENFARELMELFTLGKGQYSEKDIKESARAFTGYFHSFKADFVFRNLKHDYEVKSFMGKQGRFNGDDIIDIILSQKQCAQFICEKIYRNFVNDKINEKHVDLMVKEFYPKYDIGQLMQFVFMSDWFYESNNIGALIKSPIELLVGINTVIPLKFKRPNDLFVIQNLLGQVLLTPPNVAGWKGGKAWINSNTILSRLRLPSILLTNAHISLKEKGEFNDMLSELIKKNMNGKKLFEVETDLDTFKKNFDNISVDNLSSYVIAGTFNSGTKAYMETLGKSSKFDHCVQLMSLPEYQMC